MSSIKITLPDGSVKEMPNGSTGLQVAQAIGPRLASAALAVKVNGVLRDLWLPINEDCTLEILTFSSRDGKEVFWHSTTHVLAYAVKELYPETKLCIGPPVDEGFYYDFYREKPFTEEDLAKLEAKMKELVAKALPSERHDVSKPEAKKFFEERSEKFKLEMLEEFDKVSFYSMGPGFRDMCRGPHIPNTSAIKALKLTMVASAYWRGDAKRESLQRIYGVSYPEQKMLDEFLTRKEEASKRDHRKLGQSLDLFTFSDLVGPGLPLWTPKGTILRQLLDEYVWELRRNIGYQRVEIPHITKKELYMQSGHWEKFQNDLFKITTREGHEFAMKPMNCPHHTQIYARRQWSYRDLPQRYANTTMCYRDEQTGELNGLSRVRAFTQDDAHVFCRFTQVKGELAAIWDNVVNPFYTNFGFKLRLRLSLHDPAHPEKYLGGKERWAEAEKMLRDLAKERNADFVEGIGEAAFYGPKLDFLAKDSLGREWQVATIQLDMNMPERFDLTCIAEDGKQERIVMIHAAIMGSIERFLSILIEHYAGLFPVWISPVQVALLPMNDDLVSYAQELKKTLFAKGIRCEVDDSAATVEYKVRDAQLQKIPYMLVLGKKEKESGVFAVRTRKGELKQGVSLEQIVSMIADDVREKR